MSMDKSALLKKVCGKLGLVDLYQHDKNKIKIIEEAIDEAIALGEQNKEKYWLDRINKCAAQYYKEGREDEKTDVVGKIDDFFKDCYKKESNLEQHYHEELGIPIYTSKRTKYTIVTPELVEKLKQSITQSQQQKTIGENGGGRSPSPADSEGRDGKGENPLTRNPSQSSHPQFCQRCGCELASDELSDGWCSACNMPEESAIK